MFFLDMFQFLTFFLGSVILQKLSTTPCSDKCNFEWGWNTNVNKHHNYEKLKSHTCIPQYTKVQGFCE